MYGIVDDSSDDIMCSVCIMNRFGTWFFHTEWLIYSFRFVSLLIPALTVLTRFSIQSSPPMCGRISMHFQHGKTTKNTCRSSDTKLIDTVHSTYAMYVVHQENRTGFVYMSAGNLTIDWQVSGLWSLYIMYMSMVVSVETLRLACPFSILYNIVSVPISRWFGQCLSSQRWNVIIYL